MAAQAAKRRIEAFTSRSGDDPGAGELVLLVLRIRSGALGDVGGDVDRVISLDEVGHHHASISRKADLVEDDVLDPAFLEPLHFVLPESVVEVGPDLPARPRVLQRVAPAALPLGQEEPLPLVGVAALCRPSGAAAGTDDDDQRGEKDAGERPQRPRSTRPSSRAPRRGWGRS